MIKGIILDIDGVIIGQKIGFNSPTPHSDVIKALREIRSKGIFISLCTAKPHFSIYDIIKLAKLDNLHITDGGSVIVDPINSVIVKKFVIEKQAAEEVIKTYLENEVYTEFYTGENYFIQKNQHSEITKKHLHILQRNPIEVDSLVKESVSSEITKIMPIAKDEEDKKRLTELFKPFKNKLTLHWGIHPVALPLQFGIITAPGISKKQGAIEIAKYYKVSFENILGVGDSTSDWEFIQLCSFAGAIGNASKELKELVSQKGQGRFFVGETVDENGILDIFSFFKVL